MFLPVRGWQTRQYQRLKLGTQKTLPPGCSKGSISLHFVTVTGTRKHPKWNLLRYLVKFIEVHIFVDFNFSIFPLYLEFSLSFFSSVKLGPGWNGFSCFSFCVQVAGMTGPLPVKTALPIWAFPKIVRKKPKSSICS